MEKLPGAVAEFDRVCGGAIAAAVARIDRSPELHDEVRQVLWQRLFVGRPGQSPRIESYAGRGPLAGWSAVAAQRVALDLRRERARTGRARSGGGRSVAGRRTSRGGLPAHALQARVRGGGARRAGGAARSRPVAAAADHGQRPLPRADREHLQVNQSTVSRWISRARSEVLRRDGAQLCDKLGVPRDEFLSLAGLLVSHIDVSISRVLDVLVGGLSPSITVRRQVRARRCRR